MKTGDGADEPGSQPATADPVVRIGRFEIGGVLGSGGMGVVYKAYDPELGRTIALKMVRTSSPEATVRQKREARAMAQISHPNVVAIHDVGTHDGELFLVMELIAGTTLAQWLHAGERSWRETIAMFIAAGHGLAAAHAAGLVHRDFKPHNVLVGDDGRARVTDFGLAREESSAPEPASAVEETKPSAGLTPLTSAGRVMGTPAYMAPEQHLGAPADARADQFGFAIALWEALHGERPFAGATAAAIRAAVIGGNVRAPRNRDVPAFVQRALTRALAANPAQRWPSMNALLAALASDPRRRWRRLGVGAGALGAVAATVWVWGHFQASRARGEAAATCSVAGSVDGTWDDRRKREVKAALLATATPFAADAWRRIETELDAYSTAWSAATVRSCEDTRVRGIASEQVFQLRERCLGRKQIELRALVDELATADASTIAHATAAIGALEAIEPCLAEETSETSDDSPTAPWDPVLAAQVSALWPRYAKANMLEQAGRYREALDEANGALATATALAYPPLTARLTGTLGRASIELGDLPGARRYLTQAAAEAERAHEEALHLSLLENLVDAIDRDQEHDEEARRWRTMIEAGLSHLDPRSRCKIGGFLAEDEAINGHDSSAAIARSLAVVKQCEALDPLDDDLLAGALVALADARYTAGDGEQAIADLRRALPLDERALGPDHPDNALIHAHLGLFDPRQDRDSVGVELLRALDILDKNHLENTTTYSVVNALSAHHAARGEFDRALRYARQARELAARLYGPAGVRVASAMIYVASAQLGLGELDEALRVTRAARQIIVERVGEHVLDVAVLDLLETQILERKGRPREALAIAERALPTATATAEVPSDTAGPHALLGDLYSQLGNRSEAMAHYRAALDLIDREPKRAQDDDVIATLTGMGELLTAQGHAPDAVEPLERALARLDGRAIRPFVAARTRFALAAALWLAGGDRARALDLAHRASEDFARTTYPHARELARVRAWLADKPTR
jgi:tetratricopeptide (TPR) repeat protein